MDMIIKGTIKRGLGKAGNFLSMMEYSSLIKEVAGFFPYPGTVNLMIGRKDSEIIRKSKKWKKIPGFEKNSIAYGGLFLHKCEISGREAMILFPEKGGHDLPVIEIITRDRLNIGDSLEITF